LFRFALLGMLLLLILAGCSHRRSAEELNHHLLEAAREGDPKLADRLLRDGANLEARDETGLRRDGGGTRGKSSRIEVVSLLRNVKTR